MESHPLMACGLFGTFLFFLFCGVHVAWAMGGSALLFTAICAAANSYGDQIYDLDFETFSLVIERIYGLLENDTLVALPLFVLMGHLLDESGVAARLMRASQQLLGRVRGGLAVSVTGIGILLAASTGIIGASVVLLGILSIPAMLQQGYRKELATGTVCAAGTLGILIPPSIMLIVMADRLRVPAGDLFMGALLPGLLLGTLYLSYIVIYARLRPQAAPLPRVGEDRKSHSLKELGMAVIPTLTLIVVVLGSIFFGIATPTEASGLGAFGALLLAICGRQLSLGSFRSTLESTLKTLGLLFAIFVGATSFALGVAASGRRFSDYHRVGKPRTRLLWHGDRRIAPGLRPRVLPRLDRNHHHRPATCGRGGGVTDVRLCNRAWTGTGPIDLVCDPMCHHPPDVLSYPTGGFCNFLRQRCMPA